ncbi:MAG: aspartate--tRNA ligase [Phycisphaeraceae bacterium]
MIKRTHSCGALRTEHIGQTVSLAGWVNSYRDHGGVIFIDLRDREGITQVVFHPEHKEAHDLADKLRNEDVAAVTGTCIAREAGMENKKLPTGAVEIQVTDLEILNKAQTPPFLPDDAERVGEETRLRYRYIDLRRPRMQEILRTRHRVSKIMRDYFDANGFYEVETPMLYKSTPEGAREFLVPSRLQAGAFYALPQSPQLFKQILMVSGMERYFQIVRCFRDEDPRADRQAEFTQLDLEMSFVDRDDVLAMIEGLVRRIWKEVLGIEVPAIQRMSYAEAMDRFGIDRPDMRFGMELKNIGDLAAKTDFGVFKGTLEKQGLVKAICVTGGGAMTRKETDGLAEWSKGYGGKGVAVTKVVAGGASGATSGGLKLDTGIAKFLAPVADELIARMEAKEGDLLCFVADAPKTVHKVLGELRQKMARDRGMIQDGDWKWLWIIDFPSFEKDEEAGRWIALHHPFTSPRDEDIDKLESDPGSDAPGNIIAKAYDLVCNGSELGGGSIRIHRPEVQSRVFKLLGLTEESARQKFGFLLDALKYGAPPHGGIALGLDRIIMHLCNTTNIRDVIAFPKTQNGADLMTEAPSPVEEKQLNELFLRVMMPAKPGKTPEHISKHA